MHYPRCIERERTSGRVIQRGGKTMEASKIFSNDTCLTEFDQVMSKRLSVSKWKQELTERSHKSKHKLTHPLCLHLYMDPSSQRSRGWNFAHCKELLLVLRQTSENWVIYALLEVKRGFFAGRLMLGQEPSVVTPPGSSCLSNKNYLSFSSMILYH